MRDTTTDVVKSSRCDTITHTQEMSTQLDLDYHYKSSSISLRAILLVEVHIQLMY